MARNLLIYPVVFLFFLPADSKGAEILWTQYCQHRDGMKLMVHLDAQPTEPVSALVTLWIKVDGEWQQLGSQQMYTLASAALFEMREWPGHREVEYKVTCGDSSLEGVFRAEPKAGSTVRMIGVSCLKSNGWPWKEAVEQMIGQKPDLLYFAGDQIYEDDYGSEHIVAAASEEVPDGMVNYLEKYRKFGQAFRDLLKDYPSIMITDDHDVYANDLWGKGGLRMVGDRTTGGYRCHPNWVNAVEFTQTGVLPDAVNKGPHGDGIFAYYTSLEYGGVKFAILEDRKFKSPPSEVLAKPVLPVGYKSKRKPAALEVVRDPDFDCRTLDRDDLQLLGREQEDFLRKWSANLKETGGIGAVLSQSPWAHIAMYSPTSADLDSNGWPQSGRNRALAAIGDAPVVMLHGDVHLGTLFRHGREKWNDGPVSYSLPAFSSGTGRSWAPLQPGLNRSQNAPAYTGEHTDRFGNKVTVYGAENGLNGYGLIVFDQKNKEITMEFHAMDRDRKPFRKEVYGWPMTVKFQVLTFVAGLLLSPRRRVFRS